MEELRFPVGKFDFAAEVPHEQRAALIDEIAAAPARLRAAIQGLDHAQLDTPYREGGWTVRQVVHHMPDSHINGYVRFRLGLTEDSPEIPLYDEKLWAEMADARTAPPEISLALLDAIHQRWVALLRSLSADDFERTIRSPKWRAPVPLRLLLRRYEWHGRHHTAHITSLRERMGW